MPRRIPRFLWHNLAVVALLVSSFVSVYVLYEAQTWTHANRARIRDIQQSRYESCLANYEGVRQIFKPFFVTKTLRTRREQEDVNRFNGTVNRLKRGCTRQTRTEEP